MLISVFFEFISKSQELYWFILFQNYYKIARILSAFSVHLIIIILILNNLTHFMSCRFIETLYVTAVAGQFQR